MTKGPPSVVSALHGLIDDCRIYDRLSVDRASARPWQTGALSAAEIQALHQAGQ